jgi:hypothetical protein
MLRMTRLTGFSKRQNLARRCKKMHGPDGENQNSLAMIDSLAPFV